MNYLKVAKSKYGKGLFAKKSFKKNGSITSYLGILISLDQYRDGRQSKYFMSYNTRWVLDGDIPCNVARFINHSFTPNCYTEDDGRGGIGIYALRKINIGEELYLNYGYTKKEIDGDPEYDWYKEIKQKAKRKQQD